MNGNYLIDNVIYKIIVKKKDDINNDKQIDITAIKLNWKKKECTFLQEKILQQYYIIELYVMGYLIPKSSL